MLKIFRKLSLNRNLMASFDGSHCSRDGEEDPYKSSVVKGAVSGRGLLDAGSFIPQVRQCVGTAFACPK